MKIAALQLDIAWENRLLNYSRVKEFAEQARAASADILVLPEMFATGFSLNPEITAEEPDGPTVRFLSSMAQDLNMGVIAGVAFKAPANKAQNCAVIFDKSGKHIITYTKMKLFSFAGEERTHIRGESPVTFQVEGLKASCFICYDLRFPSLFQMVSKQCDVIFVIASWPKTRRSHWNILLPARAVENQLYVVGVNRVGAGGGLTYDGDTQIISPLGVQIVQAHGEQLVYGEIDPTVVKKVRDDLPFIKDR